MKIPRKNKKAKLEAQSIPVTETGCWLWLGVVSNMGYGKVGDESRTVSAHRLSYEVYKGLIPEEMLVLHTCDIRSCINPEHLFLGTQSENIKDMYKKKRFTASHWKNEAIKRHTK